MRFGQYDDKVETPPRAWGRRKMLYVMRVLARNTPTGVGKTFQR